VDKPSLVQQFGKWMVITFVVRKTEAIALVLPGLMAGWQADEIFKIIYQMKYLSFLSL